MRRVLAAVVVLSLAAPTPSFAEAVELSLRPIETLAAAAPGRGGQGRLDLAQSPAGIELSPALAAPSFGEAATAAQGAAAAVGVRAGTESLARAAAKPEVAQPALSRAFDNVRFSGNNGAAAVVGAFSSMRARLSRWTGAARAAGFATAVAVMTHPAFAHAQDAPPMVFNAAPPTPSIGPATAHAATQTAAHGSFWGPWSLIGLFVLGVTGLVLYFRWRDNRQQKNRDAADKGSAQSAGGLNPGGIWGGSRKKEKSKEEDAKNYPGGRDASGEPITFATVAGQDEAKEELQKVLHFHKNTHRYKDLNPRIKGQKGILLYGPPGTGKTLLAQALANESGMHFVKMNGSDFINKYVGTGPAAVRELFNEARGKGGPTIIFIDEIEAILKKRTGDANNKEDDKTVNAILAELDGFEKDPNIIVIGATNLPDQIDPAALRGGRFALQVPVGLPDLNGRKAVFERYLKGMKLGPGIDAEVLARQTPGTAGADIEYVVNRASMEAGFKGEKEVSMERFLEALDERAAGLKRKILMRPAEKRVLAYHEGGHALMSHLLPDADPVRKVTIVSAGLQALGYMQAMPDEERYMYSRKWLIARMAVAFGGRIGEELATGEKFSGASNDIQQASVIARAMVTEYGMSEKVGPIAFDPLFSQHKAGTARSEEANRRIDEEVARLVNEALDLARRTLTDNRAVLDRLAAELQEKETLRGPDLERIIPGAKKPKEPK